MNTPPEARHFTTALTPIHIITMNEAAATVPRAHTEINLSEKDIARFWSKVDKNGPTQPHMVTPCWLWMAGKNIHGYGRFKIGGKTVGSHRVAWIIANGHIPHDGSFHGICALHTCDRRDCCRADHLFIGTAADNAADRVAKGRSNPPRGDKNGSRLHPDRIARGNNHYSRLKPERMARGEASVKAKLTAAEVIYIRAIYAAGGISFDQLAIQFGVSKSCIHLIIARENWKHIP